MFTVGSILLALGISSLTENLERAIALICLGSLLFIPGSYASYILYGAFREWHGFAYDQVPSYDD